MADIKELGADVALSVFFGYILSPGFIDLFPQGVINLHPAYVPYNRGAFTNVWSIVDDTPAGATLHYIDTGVDTGDMIAQRRVSIEPVDTANLIPAHDVTDAVEAPVTTEPIDD